MELLKTLRQNKQNYILKIQEKQSKKRQNHYQQKMQQKILTYVNLQNNIQCLLAGYKILQRITRSRFKQSFQNIKCQGRIQDQSLISPYIKVQSDIHENLRKQNIFGFKVNSVFRNKNYELLSISFQHLRQINSVGIKVKRFCKIIQSHCDAKMSNGFQSIKMCDGHCKNMTEQTSKDSMSLDFLNISQIKTKETANFLYKNPAMQIQLTEQQQQPIFAFSFFSLAALRNKLDQKKAQLTAIEHQKEQLINSQNKQIIALKNKLKQIQRLGRQVNDDNKQQKSRKKQKKQNDLEHILMGKYMRLSLQLEQKLAMAIEIISEIYDSQKHSQIHPFISNQFKYKFEQIKKQAGIDHTRSLTQQSI